MILDKGETDLRAMRLNRNKLCIVEFDFKYPSYLLAKRILGYFAENANFKSEVENIQNHPYCLDKSDSKEIIKDCLGSCSKDLGANLRASAGQM